MEREVKKTHYTIDPKKAKKLKLAVVVSRFNDDITGKMLEGALGVFKRNGIGEKNVSIAWVPGAYEIPLACKKIFETKKYDGIVALGCVIQGETDHHLYISNEASKGIMKVMLEFSKPIGFGVITVKNLEQALARSWGENNKGGEAAEALLEMLGNFF